VLLGLHDLADGEIRQPRAAILDLFDLEAQIGQRVSTISSTRGLGLKVILQPGQGEFHLRPH
jgi:hypothetical protein